MRIFLVLLIACGSSPEPSPEADTTGSESAEAREPVTPDSAEPTETETAETPPASCNVQCMRDESPCGRWVGADPMQWEECPVECCDMSNPVSARPVELHELAYAASRDNASTTITALGRHRISPRCEDVEWEPLPNDRERGTCPSGWVHLGEVRAELSLEITRVASNTSASSAVLHLRAETPGEAWTSAMRTAVRAAWDETLGEMAIAEEMRPDQEIFELGGTRFTLREEGARLSRITRSTPR